MNVLFICTGNTCRSPMAEGIFRMEALRSGMEHFAFSRGIFAAEGAPASGNAVIAAAELGADIGGHCSGRVTRADVDAADRIVCMTAAQLSALTGEFPECADKAGTLSETDIEDPFGGGREEYRVAAGQIARGVRALVRSL